MTTTKNDNDDDDYYNSNNNSNENDGHHIKTCLIEREREKQKRSYSYRTIFLISALFILVVGGYLALSIHSKYSSASAGADDNSNNAQRYPGSISRESVRSSFEKRENKILNLVKTNKNLVFQQTQTQTQPLKVDTQRRRKLQQFLAPVRYSLPGLFDAMQDLIESLIDLSITPLQARVAPYLRFRETNLTDSNVPLEIDREKVKQAREEAREERKEATKNLEERETLP